MVTSTNPQHRAYLLVGHGTRKPEGAAQLRTVYEQFAPLVAPHASAYCFLELAVPNIADTIAALAEQGVREIVTVPLLLFTAGHAVDDIPNEVESIAGRYGIHVLHQTASLGCSPEILELSAERFRESIAKSLSGPELASAGLVMVGRGSSSPSATQQMRQFADLRRELTPVDWMSTAFIHAQQPSVEQALEDLAAADVSLAVVQPHLLFDGVLVDQLRQQVADWQAKSESKRWVITETLGTDRALAESLAKRAFP